MSSILALKNVIKDFSEPCVDEIIVVDNNSTDRTSQFAKNVGAKVIKEKRQGYGFALQKGMKKANGDVIILTESDCTFNGNDIYKFLSYIDDVDMILGTRLTKELMERGAKMDWFLTWGNLFLAKLIQLKFWGKVRLTDVGCTFRAINKKALKKILDKFTVGGSHFSPEMIIRALESDLKTVEIPVHYNTRIGDSKITSTKFKSFKVGLKMLWLIFFGR